MMDTTAREADRLNDIWDAHLRSVEQATTSPDQWLSDLHEFLSADAGTPEPDAEFLRSLRVSLIHGTPSELNRARGRNTFGIVAYPYSLGLNGHRWSKRAILFAIAVILAIAILSTGLTLQAGGHPAIGLPTAQASAIVASSTPTARSTAVVEASDR